MKKTFFLILALYAIVNCYSQTSKEFYKRGIIKDSLKDYKGAIDDYTKAIEIDKSNDFAFTYRGIAKFNLKNYEEAIADFKHSIEIIIEKNKTTNKNENFGIANLKYYGKAKFELGEYKSSLKIFLKCIEQYPKHHFTYELIAKVYEKINDSANHKIHINKFNILNEEHLKRIERGLLRKQPNEKKE